MSETIVAIATSSGMGSIAIVRLSGTLALQLALKLSKSTKLKPRYAHLKTLYSTQNELLDEAIVIYYENPHRGPLMKWNLSKKHPSHEN